VKSHNILIFLTSILVALGSVSAVFPREGIDVGARKLYFLTMEEILHGDELFLQELEQQRAAEEELRLQRLQQLQDSIYTDSLSRYIAILKNSAARIDFPDDDINFFNDLFAEMDSCEERGKTVRILHYGDSQIEADRMTGYIRQYMQERFGGSGAGLLPAVQPIPSYSIKQSASGNITRYMIESMLQNKASHRRYGVMGQFGQTYGESSISISAKSKYEYEKVRDFKNVQLFVGRDTNFRAQLSLNGKATANVNITRIAPIKVYTWDLSEPVDRFSLSIAGAGEIYGIAVDGASGVAVDNIPFRGSSGTFFTSIDQTVSSAMFKQLNARLIMLEFGGNSVPYISTDKAVAYYCNTMLKQINYFREICPDAKIMLIGVSDMSTKVDGHLTTYPHLERLNNAMKEMAITNGAAFWNMYEAMGGKNSMIKWVNQSLAGADHIHFTTKGVERIASLFCETLMIYYDYYNFVNNNKISTCEETHLSD
jgi:lysophospholipase L1-like esterase